MKTFKPHQKQQQHGKGHGKPQQQQRQFTPTHQKANQWDQGQQPQGGQQAASVLVSGFEKNLKKLNGEYGCSDMSSGKQSFIKGTGRDQCCVYFFQSDDDNMQGWWIAPEINGDDVWARSYSSKGRFPPIQGWHIPHTAAQPNPNISVKTTFEKKPQHQQQQQTQHLQTGQTRAIHISSNAGAPNKGGKPTTRPESANVVGQKRPLPHQHQSVKHQPPAKKQKTAEEIKECYEKIIEELAGMETKMPPCEEVVDQLKDAGVMFTCEVVDHIGADEVLEMKSKTEEIGGKAKEKLGEIKKSLDICRTGLGHCTSESNYADRKKTFDEFQKKFEEMQKEVNVILADCQKASHKAQAKKRQEEQEKKIAEQKAKQEAAQAAQRLAVQKVAAFHIIVKPLKEQFKEMKSLKKVVDTEAIILAMEAEIEKDMKHCDGQNLHVLKKCTQALKPFLKDLQERRKDLRLVDSAEVDLLSTVVAQAIQKQVADSTMEKVFKKISDGQNDLSSSHLENYVEKLDLGETKCDKELIGTLFERAVMAANVGKEEETDDLSFDEFDMYVARVLYSTRGSVLIIDGDKKKTRQIPDGDIVEVLEGPSAVSAEDNTLRCRCKLMDGAEGSVLFKTLQRMSAKFSVVNDTVLTDKHELKGFNVVQRLKPGTKIVATKFPSIDTTTKLVRVSVEVVPAEGAEEKAARVKGFVTVKGNQGSQLIKQDAPAAMEFGAGAVTAKEMSMDAWTEMVGAHTEDICKVLTKGTEEIASLKEDCEGKCVLLEALKDGWTEDVLTEACDAAKASWEKIDALIRDLGIKMNTHTPEFQNVDSNVEGPLSKVKKTIEETRTSLRDAKKAHMEMTKVPRELHQKLMRELEVQTRKKQVALDEEFMNNRIDECIARKELTLGLDNRVRTKASTEEELLEYEKTLEEAQEEVEKIRTWVEETKKSAQGKNVKKHELQKILGELMGIVSKLNTEQQKRSRTLQKRWGSLVDQGAVQISKALREQMEMAQQTEEQLFASVSAGKEVVTLSDFKEQMTGLKIDLSESILEKIFRRVAPKGSSEVSINQYAFLTKCYYRVVKETVITEDEKPGKTLCKLEVDESVQLLALMDIDSTQCQRCKVSFNDGEKTVEGYATVKTQGVQYLEPQGFFYKVNKDTVLTQAFEMSGLKIVRRLRTDDIVRVRSLPRKETKTGLWRIEVLVMLDKKATKAPAAGLVHTGFVTMKGTKKGTSYLSPCNTDGMDLEEPSVEVPATEEKVEKKSDEDVVMA